MYTDEQLAAWTRLKDHLINTMVLLKTTADSVDTDKIHDEVETIVDDIEKNIDIVETMFII